MATNLGTAYVSVMPSMKGFGKAVESGMSGIDTTSAGTSMGQKTAKGFAGGMASEGVVIGAASAIATKAFDAIASSAGAAVSRVDTMNNFPRIMKNMGIGADEAEKTVSTLSERLTGLPTTLDSAVSSVERFTLKNGDLKRSADMFLAVNDAILAGGAPTMQQASALEQLSQAYSKGRMDIQEWRSLQQAMPAQLKQVADSMGITVEQLGAGLRGARDSADYLNDISMDEFIDQIMRLDKEGVNGLASFEEQARDSTTGIQTAIDNLHTAIVRGVANVLDAVGQENISGAINFLGSEIGGVIKSLEGDAKAIAGIFIANKDAIMGVVRTLADIAPWAIRAWTAFKLFQGGRAIFSGVAGSMRGLLTNVNSFGERIFYAGVKMQDMGVKGGAAMQGIGNALGGLTAGPLAIISAALAVGTVNAFALANRFEELRKHQENVTKTTEGLRTAADRTASAIGNMEGKTRDLSEASKTARIDTEAMWESQAAHVDAINTIADSAETEIISLNSAQAAIEELAGKTDLTTQEQGRLSAALGIVNDALGTNYKAVDLANGKISDSQGAYDDAAGAAGAYKDEILKLIDAQKQQLQLDATKDALKEMYEGRAEAYKNYVQALSDYNKYSQYENQGNVGDLAIKTQLDNAKKSMDEAKASVDSWDSSISMYEQNMGTLSNQINGTASEFAKFASNNTGFSTALTMSGHSLDEFERQLGETGLSVSDLSQLSDRELMTLASSFQGNSASITATLEGFRHQIDDTNAKKLLDKRAEVKIRQDQLVDAQGNLYTWNGTQLKGKDGQVVVDDVQLVNAQGELYVWNGSRLVPQYTSVTVSGTGDMYAAINTWEGWRPTVKAISVVVQSVASAIGAAFSATGGFVDMHASGGFITNGPTSLGVDRNGVLHIAGEAGREWVQEHADGTTSIVPIENKRYLQPYAETIASMIGGGGGDTINITVNAATNADPDEIAGAIGRKLKMIQMARGR